MHSPLPHPPHVERKLHCWGGANYVIYACARWMFSFNSESSRGYVTSFAPPQNWCSLSIHSAIYKFYILFTDLLQGISSVLSSLQQQQQQNMYLAAEAACKHDKIYERSCIILSDFSFRFGSAPASLLSYIHFGFWAIIWMSIGDVETIWRNRTYDLLAFPIRTHFDLLNVHILFHIVVFSDILYIIYSFHTLFWLWFVGGETFCRFFARHICWIRPRSTHIIPSRNDTIPIIRNTFQNP